MRALLVVNQKATVTSAGVRDVLIQVLGSDLKLDVAETEHRGHATTLAEQAALDGLDLVVALGGDGTVNEVTNGLMRVGDPTDPGTRPSLAVVPGGSANVFSRVLGQPLDPVEATCALLQALRAQRRTTVSLGLAGDRYFTFGAGLGLDAEVVALVEQRRALGARATPALYARAALKHYFTGPQARHPRLTVQVPGEKPIGPLAMVIVSNTTPWTYCGRWPLHACPGSSFTTALDLFAMRRLRTFSTVRTLAQMAARGGGGPRGRHVVRRADVTTITVSATEPLALQIDGDYCGLRERVIFSDVPRALHVLA